MMKSKENRRMNKKITLIMVSAGLLLAGCQRGGAPKETPQAEAGKIPSVKVRTAPVETGDIQQWINLFGDVQAKSTIAATPDTNGRIHGIYVRPGDFVKKGQKIADVDPSRPGLQYALSPVLAPITGTVTSVLGQKGAMTSPQGVIAQIGLLDELEVTLQVPERFIFQLELGRGGTVTTEALPGFSQEIVISEISPVVNPLSRTALVTLSLVEDQGKLRPGMYGDIRLLSDDKKGVIITSLAALVQREEATYVFVDDQGKARLTPVEIGIRSEGRVQIISGLQPGERVITSGKNLLYNGAPVFITREESL